MQIKGKNFIPPTNLLWLAAIGLWGESQPRRKPESESLAPLCCQTLCRMDLLLLKDAQLPGFDILLGGSAAGERALGGRGVSAWQTRAGTVPRTGGGTGTGTRGQQPGGKPWGAGGVRDARQGQSLSEDKKLRPGAPARGEGTRERAQSCSCTKWAARVGAPPQTVNL